MRSTSFLQIARPRPVPPKRRVVDASAWMKLSKRRDLLCGVDADAGVGDLESHAERLAVLRFLSDTEDDFTTVGELHRVAKHVDEDLANPARVPSNSAWASGDRP